jgi:hypothetical protein
MRHCQQRPITPKGARDMPQRTSVRNKPSGCGKRIIVMRAQSSQQPLQEALPGWPQDELDRRHSRLTEGSFDASSNHASMSAPRWATSTDASTPSCLGRGAFGRPHSRSSEDSSAPIADMRPAVDRSFHGASCLRNSRAGPTSCRARSTLTRWDRSIECEASIRGERCGGIVARASAQGSIARNRKAAKITR